MPKFYEIKGRVAISGNPMTDAKLLGKFQAEYDALASKFAEAGGTLDMRVTLEKTKPAAAAETTSLPEAPEPARLRRHAAE